MRGILLFLFLSFKVFAGALPPTGGIVISSNASVCQNSSGPVVTFTGNGGTAPYIFTYNINGGGNQTIQTSSSSNTITLNASTATSGVRTYNLLSVEDGSGTSTISGSVSFTVLPQPDATMGGTGGGTTFGGVPVFRVCANVTSTLNFTNTSTTLSANQSYTIDWGDSSPDFTGTNWTALTHTYNVGIHTLTYTIIGTNGCSITKNYTVFVGSNPAVALGNPGNTDICSNQTLTFPITGTENNPLGTIYTVTFNDGSPPQVFNHPAPSTVSHTFSVSSCGTTSSDGSNTYPNSFYANIVASNPCSTSSVGVVPIYVSATPDASFTSPTSACTNSTVTITDTSIGSQVLSGSCSSPGTIWTISPNTGFSVVSGNLGNDFGFTDPTLWQSGSPTLGINFTAPGTYSISIKVANKCDEDTETKTICISAPLTPTFTLNPSTGCGPLSVSATNTTNAAVSCTAPTHSWTVTHTLDACASNTVTIPTQTTTNANWNFTEPGTYNITLTSTNSCGSPSTTQTVTVKRPPIVSIASIADFCGPGNITPSATVNACSPNAATYAWSFPGGTPASSTAANPGAVNYATPGTYTISLVVTNECGASATATETFTVNPTPQITNAGLTQSMCSGTSSSPINFTTSIAGTTVNWTAVSSGVTSGFPASGTGDIASQIITSGASGGTVTITATPTSNGCTGNPVQFVITISPAPVITQQPQSQTLCQGGSANPLVVGVNASGTATYQWYTNDENSTDTPTLIPGAASDTFTPNTLISGTYYYYNVITLTSGGCSQLTSQIAEIIVLPQPTVSVSPTTDQQICTGGTPNTLTASVTGGTGSVTWQWYSNNIDQNFDGVVIPGATSATFTPPVLNTAGDYYYYAQVTMSGVGCGAPASAVVHVNVVADPAISAQPIASQNLCQGMTPATLTVTASGGLGAFSYQWYQTPAATPTGGSPISSATSASFIPDTSVIGTQNYYVVITQTASGCQATSQLATIVVNQSPSITTQPQSQTVCTGGTTAALSFVTANGSGTPTYQWFQDTDADATGGTEILGETNVTYTPSAATEGTFYYYAQITFPGITGPCATITTNAATITVTPPPAITTQPAPNHTICAGGSLDAPLEFVFNGGSGNAMYQWFSNTTPVASGGTAINGATSAQFNPPVFTATGPHYFYATVTLAGSGCGAATTNLVTVNVLADPVVLIAPAIDQILCEGQAAQTLTATTTGGSGNTSYQWYSNNSNSTTTGTPVSGATSATFEAPVATVGTMYYYVIATQDVSGCEDVSETVKITVNTSPSVVQQPQDVEVCVGASAPALSFTTQNGQGNATYQWFLNTSDSSVGGTEITGETNAAFTPPTTTEGTFYYYAQITFDGIEGDCARITTNAAQVTITPLPQITTQPIATQTLCVGGSVPSALTIAYSGGSGTPTYQWYQNTANSTSGGTPVGTNSADYLPPAFASAGTYYFYATVTLAGSGCGDVTSDVAQITVVQDPVMTQQPLAQQTVCQGETPATLTVAASGGVGAVYDYQWFESATAIPGSGTAISGETAADFIPPTTTTGTFYYYAVITQPGDTGCDVTSDISMLTVSPAPAITTQSVSQTACIDEALNVLGVTIANGVGTPTYQWFSNTSAVNSGGLPISGETQATFMPYSAAVGTFYYYVEVNYPDLVGSCAHVTSDAVTITINQDPVIADASTVICSATSFTLSPVDSGPDIVPMGTTYTWADPVINPAGSVTGASAENVPQNQITQTLINVTTQPATVTYTIVPVSGACPGDAFTFTVTVNPAINPNIVLVDNLCFGADSASISTNVTGGIPFPGTNPYQYDWSGPNGFTSVQSGITNLEPGEYTVTITDAGGCPFTQTYTITEPTELVFDTTSESDVTCFGFADGTINISLSGGTLPYSYSWTKDTAPFSSDQNLSNLAPATYVITATDANNCGPITMTFTITQPDPLVATLVSQVNVECFGESTGEINISVSGGTPIEITPGEFGYLYSWTGPNGFTSASANLTNLFAGDYNVLVTDANNCQFNLPVTITQHPEIVISYTTTEISCYGANDATMNVTISGGQAPYTFTWSNLSTLLYQTNLSAGDYTITVTDDFGCVRSLTINIPEAPVFMVDPIVTQISCHGENDGSIQLNLTGGIAPVVLVWSDGSQDGLTRNGLSAGTYTATITDGKPCQIVRTFVIVEPAALTASAVVTDALDCTQTDSGAIDLIVSGGTPPYVYSWSSGQTVEDLTDITNGNYAVTVTDSRGCVVQGQWTVSRPDPIAVTINTTTDANCETHEVNQTFTANVSGGMPPYQLSWSSGTVSGPNNNTMQTTVNGAVILSITDAMGCVLNHTLDVDIPELGYPEFEPDSFGYTSYGIFSIQDPVTFNSSIAGDFEDVIWDFGDGTFSNEHNPTHTYIRSGSYVVKLEVSYPFGCRYTHIITLVVEDGYFLTIPTAFTPNQDSVNDTYRPVSKRLKNIQLEVFDSWGSMIYSEKGDDLVGWDGKIKDVQAENGNYYCKVTAQTFYSSTITETRTFVLIK